MAVDSTVNECGLWKMLRAAEDPGGDCRLGFNSTLEPDLLRWTNHRNRGAPRPRGAWGVGALWAITIQCHDLAWEFGFGLWVRSTPTPDRGRFN
jgi:hypothetical protein